MADEYEDEELDLTGTLAGLRESMTELTSPSTTPIAQRYAQGILDKPGLEKEQEELMGKIGSQAEKTRQMLRDARAKILARRYNPAMGWLAASAALGSPTRTGAFGESVGNLSRSLMEPLKERDEFNLEREKDSMGVDSALAGVDTQELQARLEMLKARSGDQSRMRVKALDILGRRTPGGPGASGKPGSEFGKLAVDSLGARAYLPNGDYSPAYYAEIERLKAADKRRKDAAAGVDEGEVDLADTVAAAEELGLPVLTIDPFRALGTKQKTARMARLEKEAAARLTALDEETATATDDITDAKKIISLSGETKTGGINALGNVLENIPYAGPALKSGIDQISALGDSEARDFDAIANRLIPKMRAPGSGSSSNLDIQMFSRATVGRDKPRPTNINIANGIIAQKQRQLEHKEFLQSYKTVYGHLEGAERFWKEYLESNPIFDPELGIENGEFKLNPNRESYQDYFRKKLRNLPGLEGLSEEEQDAALVPAMAEGGKVGGMAKTIAEEVLAAKAKPRDYAAEMKGPVPTREIQSSAASSDLLTPADLARLSKLNDPDLTKMVNAYQTAFDNNAREKMAQYRKAIADRLKTQHMAEGGKVGTVIDMLDHIEKFKNKQRGNFKSEERAPVVDIKQAPKTFIYETTAPITRKLNDEDWVNNLKDWLEENGLDPEFATQFKLKKKPTWIDRDSNNPSHGTDYYETEVEGPAHIVTKLQDSINRMNDHAEEIHPPPPVKKAEGGVIEEEDDEDMDPQFWESIMHGMLQGGTMGFSDELSGNPNSTRGKIVQAYEANPTSATAGEAGGAALFLEAAKQLLLRSGMSASALKMVPQSKLLQIGQQALLGGAAGSAWGLGQSEPDSVIDDTSAAGVQGAILGPLAGLASKYGLIGLEKGADRLRGRSVSGGEKAVLEALQADSMDPAGVQAGMSSTRRLGVPSSFGEEAGQALDALQQRVASRTAGTQGLTDTAADRQKQQRTRVSDQVNRSLAPSEYFSEQDLLTSQLYQNSKPIYQKAYAKYPSLKSKALLRLLDTPSGQKAAKAAAKSLRDRPGATIGKADAKGMVQKPSLEYLDLVKRELDDMISREERQGGFGASKRIRELRNALRTELDNLAPEYKAARDQYAGDLEIRDALRSGREEFDRLQPEEVRRKIKGMTFSEKDAFRSGVAQRIFEQIDRPSTDSNFARRIVGSPAMAEKLAAMFDKPADAKRFQAALLKETELFDKRKKLVKSGEANAARRFDGSISSLPRRMMDVLESMRGLSDKDAEEAAKILDTSAGPEVDRVVKNLQPKAERLIARKRRAGKAGIVGAVIGGSLAGRDPAPKHIEDIEEEPVDGE